MLTSERKLQKLFIKFIEWGKITKAENLMALNPKLEIPWQKAFESAGMNRNMHGVEWIYKRVSHNCYSNHDIRINIHFDNDKLMNYMILHGCRYIIKWLISQDSTYPWKKHITNETLARASKDILEIIS